MMKKEVAPVNGGSGATMCGSNTERRMKVCHWWKELGPRSGDDGGTGAARVAAGCDEEDQSSGVLGSAG